MNTLEIFEVGKGINAVKLNYNFAELQQQTNTNETQIGVLANNALLKDGTNWTTALTQKIRQSEPIILSGDAGTKTLTLDREHFIAPTGNITIALPPVTDANFSHTCILVVQGSNYAVDTSVATGGDLLSNSTIAISVPYSIMFLYNRIDNKWYRYISQ